MKGVIKQNDFVSFIGTAPANIMQSPIRSIDNGERNEADTTEEKAPEITEQELEQKRLLAEHTAKLESLKKQCEQECEAIVDKAHRDAEIIVSNAEKGSRIMIEDAEKECVGLREKAENEGYSDGFTSGETPGYDTGFSKGKEECRETLDELNAILEGISDEKEKIFKDYENQLFDLIFTISNDITAGSLNQKDKSVISKMLKEAAKNFRSSSFIKVSLSKLDVEETVNVDLEDLTRIFGENQHIEFEILKEAPKGTLILDNGSEITDAGIHTQLKMIENLGKGKFKNKPPESETDLEKADGEIKSEEG